ncbi:hypothetical protein FBUS_04217 [Fasciolopsis buskii]|uniref:Uncharacterized protein n=1 Tax=Fasciolopsis buskii TaxID=27845 RepID=A0A8E0RQK5_9TREM|nr:hypothetical protein FBUS_04217 [Fasciolopsis buski]
MIPSPLDDNKSCIFDLLPHSSSLVTFGFLLLPFKGSMSKLIDDSGRSVEDLRSMMINHLANALDSKRMTFAAESITGLFYLFYDANHNIP